ncbi:heme/hemin ABC transporter substrate-binding protein [Thalassotalea ganghwensis]
MFTSLMLSLGLSAKSVDENSFRVVSAGGTITEIIFALGAQEVLVGVDQSSLYPEQASTLPMVGYYRSLSAEGVLSLQPTDLITIEGAGRPESLSLIEQAGVSVHILNKPENIEQLLQLIADVGSVFDRQQEAKVLADSIKADYQRLIDQNTENHDNVKKQLKALTAISITDRGVVVAGVETVPNFIFDSLNIDNVGKTHRGYKPMNIEALSVNQPDFIVVPEHVAKELGGKETICRLPSIRLLDAAKQCHVLVMDSLLSLALTPRVAQSLKIVDQYKVLIND